SRQAISGWTLIPSGQWPALKDETGNFIPSQVDDLDDDGEWDELFALIDMEPSSQKIVTLAFLAPGEYPAFKMRTNIRLGDATVPGYPELQTASRLEGIAYHNHERTGELYQMDGLAWENDKVGFRNYLDQRNGMDIFGKLTPEMVLDSVGIPGRQSYHEPDEWGMDILKVGTSLGSGAIGYLYEDSIYRVGDNGSGSYNMVLEGPLHSRFNLSYTDWMVNDQSLNVNHQVEIIAGRHYYQGLVSYTGSDQKLSLVTGIVNIKSDSLYVINLDNNYIGFFTHDFQAEDTSLLAMALIVPSTYLKTYGATRDEGEGITQTYYVILEAHTDDPIPYRFYALWEKEDSRWASRSEVSEFLKSEAERWTQSLMYEVLL
ncbi:MAG: DUF4861 family protein, partial [Anaerolineales bacterium]|nr:DUF4861 family protein [Anaerolineales bacterium]